MNKTEETGHWSTLIKVIECLAKPIKRRLSVMRTKHVALKLLQYSTKCTSD